MNEQYRISNEDLLAYRQKHFTVEVTKLPSHLACGPGELKLSIRHNTHQWHSLTLLPHEAEAVIVALRKEIGE